MLEKGKISPRQMGELLAMIMISTAILFVPSFTVKLLGQDAWLAILLGAGFGVVTLYFVYQLGERHHGQTIFQYAEHLLGKWLGKLVGLIYIWTFLRVVAIVIREFGAFMTTSFMPNTPLSVFTFSIVLLSAWAVMAGLEVIARMNEFLILLVVTSLVAVLALSMGNWDLGSLQPLFAADLLLLLETATIPEIWKVDTITIAVIMPFITRPKRVLIAGTVATLSAGALLAIGIIGTLAIFGPQLLPTFRFPLIMFVRTINIAQILSRFEVVVMVVWVAGAFLKTTYFLYCASLGFAQITGLKEYRPVVFPLGVIATVWSFSLFENIADLEKAISTPSLRSYFIYLGLPVFLLLVTIVREKFFGVSFGGEEKYE
ncbi:MAG: spore germination protein [Firmicutes bacterium]|nr:spore germination protein [Bacillota bacterium]